MRKSDEQVFFDALEFDSTDAQEAFVLAECRQDQHQADRILKFLAIQRRIDGGGELSSNSLFKRSNFIVDALLAESSRCQYSEFLPGQRIGLFTIERKLGSGGVGVVYLASQLNPIKRLVALKALKPGMDSQRILSRFEIERQVLSQLDHPGITKILDAGVDENGHPYFAMELVRDPESITEYCRRLNLTVHQRVELVIAICEIVQHAHQRGIIHRDLKPSNILVERNSSTKPQLKVIDFGIAKIIDDSATSDSLTVVGERFGTPAYMSPEQSENSLNVDTRSDIYSLGVVLFELLTGQTPFSIQRIRFESDSTLKSEASTRTSPSEWLRNAPKVDRGQPSVPQLAWNQVKGDLDSIVLKAISADRNLRYQNVRELHRDLESFLAGRPVEAVGSAWSYRLKKQIQKHMVASIGILVFVCTVLTLSIVSTVYAIRAGNAELLLRQKLNESLALQLQVNLERDQAKEAKDNAFAMMRFFQLSMAMDEASMKLTEQVLDSDAVDSLSNLDFLTEPHPRLLVPSDWSWAKRDHTHYLLLKASSDLASQEIAERTRETIPVGAPALTQSVVTPLNFDNFLLESLPKWVPADDPLVAEVLDNIALFELDARDFENAQRHLEEASRIWQRFPKHKTKYIQSQLFLAETLLHQEKRVESAEKLAQTRSLLGDGINDPQLLRLMAMHEKLQADIASRDSN